MSTDPLLRATADGDTACPDGRALAALGRSVRDASALPRPVDLVAGVLSRIDANQQPTADIDFDDDAIDAFYDGGGHGPAELVNLSALIRGAAQVPHPVDLVEGVRGQLNGSLRLSTLRGIDLGSRWRIWSTVVAGHVAALLALAVYQFHSDQPTVSEEHPSATISSSNPGMTGQIGDHAAPVVANPASVHGPASWSQILGSSIDLFAPRRSESTRFAARSAANMADTAPAVAAGLRWVLAHQDATTGRFGFAAVGDRAVAVHSLALLAVLGEGLDDAQRASATARGLAWLAAQQLAEVHDTTVSGLSLLALVEGALLTGDPHIKAIAESALAGSEPNIPAQSGPAGLGGFMLLAYETASQGGLTVSAGALETARRTLGRPMPDIEEDSGRLGIAAFARLISGRTENASTPALLEELGRTHRIPRVDPSGRIDPLGWFFASLAAHAADGALWSKWSAPLRQTVMSALVSEGDQSYLPAAKARFAESMADGDLFATSAALLELQVPYRYLQVAK